MRALRFAVGPGLVGLSALNLLAFALLKGYDLRIGALHLVAHDGFKPLQYFAASLMLALILKSAARRTSTRVTRSEPWHVGAGLGWLLAGGVAIYYLPTAFVNLTHPDWTQAHIGAGVHGLSSIAYWFTHPQVDGFYRPLGFFSLWIDYVFFGTAPVGYHLQNICFHAVNALLVGKLCSKLGYSTREAIAAAVLFGIAPVCLEPVTWPAARYELLAAFFVLSALICAADCVERKRCGTIRLVGLGLLVGAGILCKEVGYSAPLLVTALAFSGNLWRFPRYRNCAGLLVAAWIPAALGVAVRLTIYHGLGGYGYAQGSSPVVTFSPKTVWAVTTRLLIVPFALNTADGIEVLTQTALILFAVAGFLGAMLYSGRLGREHAGIALCAVLSAVPAAGLLGIVGPSMSASRYLYLPSVWIAMLLMRLLSGPRMKAALLLFALGSVAATASNLLLYREAMELAERARLAVEADLRPRQGVTSVCMAEVPRSANGLLFFDNQVLDRVGSGIRARGIAVRLVGQEGCGHAEGALLYRWNPSLRSLQVVDGNRQ